MKKPILFIILAFSLGIAISTALNFETLSQAALVSAASIFNKNDAAETLVVRFKTDVQTQTYYSFSKIGFVKSSGPSFLLESIPTKDKKPFYNWIENNRFVSNRIPLDVEIDVLAGDGSVIETLIYKDCKVDTYFVYVEDSKGSFSLSGEKQDKPEIRDVAKFSCVSFSISVK